MLGITSTPPSAIVLADSKAAEINLPALSPAYVLVIVTVVAKSVLLDIILNLIVK